MARLTTPFGYKLQTELSNEFSRMDSEWFFPWHGLNSGREIDLDRFDGRRIRLGGGTYGGSDEGVFWSAISRYLSNKINEIFELADKEIRSLGGAKAKAIVEDAANAVEDYCWRIRRHAIDTDRRLLGGGFPDPDYSSPRAERMEFSSEIARRKAALLDFFGPAEASLTKSQRFNQFVEVFKAALPIIATCFGIVVAFLTILKLLQLL